MPGGVGGVDIAYSSDALVLGLNPTAPSLEIPLLYPVTVRLPMMPSAPLTSYILLEDRGWFYEKQILHKAT